VKQTIDLNEAYRQQIAQRGFGRYAADPSALQSDLTTPLIIESATLKQKYPLKVNLNNKDGQTATDAEPNSALILGEEDYFNFTQMTQLVEGTKDFR